MEKNLLFKDLSFKDHAENEHIKVIQGIGNAYEVIDSVKDFTERGAFDNTIKDNPVIPAFNSHMVPIGMVTLNNADAGLGVKMEVNTGTTEGKDAYALAKQFHEKGRPMEMSIGYQTIKEESGIRKGQAVNLLQEVKVHEVSLVIWGANPESVVTDVKNKSEPKILGIDESKLTESEKTIAKGILKDAKEKFKDFIETGQLKGERLRSFLRGVIEELVGDRDLTRAEIVQRIADATRGGEESRVGGDVLSPSTINQILGGTIIRPSENALQGLAQALDVSIERLRELADQDAGDDGNEESADKTPHQEKQKSNLMQARIDNILNRKIGG